MKRKKLRKSHQWPRDPDDWYVEPESSSISLFREVEFDSPFTMRLSPGAVNRAGRGSTIILDPACGSGRIVRAARGAGYDGCGSDIKARWRDFEVGRPPVGMYARRNFLKAPAGDRCLIRPHWIVTNPPFRLCWTKEEAGPAPFIAKALDVASVGIALLLPHDWIAGDRRSVWLTKAGLWKVLVVVPRPSMPPGARILAGVTPGNGEHNFAWYIFRKGYVGEWTGGILRRDVSHET